MLNYEITVNLVTVNLVSRTVPPPFRVRHHLNPRTGGQMGDSRMQSHSLLTPVGLADYVVLLNRFCLYTGVATTATSSS